MSLSQRLTLVFLLISVFATLTIAHPPFNPSPTDPVGSRGWHSIHPAAVESGVSVSTATAIPTTDSNPNTDTNSDTAWRPSSLTTSLPSTFDTVRIAHAVLASCAFLIFFPFGGILIRICNRHAWIVWVHAAVQGFAYLVFVIAAALGIWMARKIDRLHSCHPVIGLILLSLLGAQPLLQLVNHRFHARYPRITIVLAHMHLWLGRTLITLGIINGGLGFEFASTLTLPTSSSGGLQRQRQRQKQKQWSRGPIIAYGVIAVLVWIGYVACLAVWAELENGRGRGTGSRRAAAAAAPAATATRRGRRSGSGSDIEIEMGENPAGRRLHDAGPGGQRETESELRCEMGRSSGGAGVDGGDVKQRVNEAGEV